MAKAMNFILGVALIICGFIAIIGYAPDYFGFVIAGVGAIIMFIPMGGGGAAGNFVRRWIFGIFLVVSGAAGLVSEILPIWIGSWFEFIKYDSYLGAAIIMFLGVIYFFSAFARMKTLSLTTT